MSTTDCNHSPQKTYYSYCYDSIDACLVVRDVKRGQKLEAEASLPSRL